MKFEWDEEKNRLNVGKHRLDFADAWEIFEGPMLVALDVREDYGEERWTGVGFLRGRTVIIVFTELEGGTIRVISLRKASRHERTRFEKEIGDRLGEA